MISLTQMRYKSRVLRHGKSRACSSNQGSSRVATERRQRASLKYGGRNVSSMTSALCKD
jgi:hypothetical protein